ncbi:hypothetical protein KZP23_02980 [Echinicola marina]|uniref:hypothetical protein n=1 Tax=Echinicola marina TaxID=2859768 RepID=UPI001CF61CD4|nr:hypothetical protein [Echinicola marina]UCS94012.1 hypothetical protein KZP23_02980 [Echinicola marina]
MIDFNTRSPLTPTLKVTLGAVMLLAILDHTRIFFHYWNTSPTDMETTTLPLFFTRTVSHFFAPSVFFLSGVQCHFYGKNVHKRKMSVTLAKKGVALILLEFAINNFLYTFDLYYRTMGIFILAILGISLLLLALLIYLPPRILFPLSLMGILGHHFLDGINYGGQSSLQILGALLHHQKFIETKRCLFIINYTILPWAPLLWAGYALGWWFEQDFPAVIRKRQLKALGLFLILVFVLLRSTGWYGETSDWNMGTNTFSVSLISFFDLNKYPASLCLITFTMGGLFLLIAFLEVRTSNITDLLMEYGNHSLFIYLFSTFTLHLAAMLTLPLEGFSIWAMVITPASYLTDSPLENHGFPLIAVYGIWLFFVAVFLKAIGYYSQLMKNKAKLISLN